MCQVTHFLNYDADELMKGPSLHYDMRVLREFRCDACGRTVQTPAYATSHTCPCSDPPKFMRPLERPKTVSPDVSRFITPVDPADEIEEEDVDRVPHVPHVPIKPAPPARFANRRKLYDDTAPADEPDFGEGVSAETATQSTFSEDVADEIPQEMPSGRSADTSEVRGGDQERSRRRRHGRGGSNDSTRSPETQRSSESGSGVNKFRDPSSTGNSGSSDSPESNRIPGGDRRTRSDRQGSGPSNRTHRNQGGKQRPQDASRRGETNSPHDAGSPGVSPEIRNFPRGAEDVRRSESHSDSNVEFPDDVSSEGHDSPAAPASPPGEGRPRRSRRRGRRRGPRPEGGGE